MVSHALQDLRERLLGEVAKRQGYQVARTHLAAAVDVQVRQAGTAAEGFGRFQIRKRGENRQILALGDLALIIEELPAFRAGEQYVSLPC